MRTGTRVALMLTVCLALLAIARPASAWLFHEHSLITAHSKRHLNDTELKTLEDAWGALRRGSATRTRRLAAKPFMTSTFDRRKYQSPFAKCNGGSWCADFAPFPALAADHSCSPDDLGWTVLQKTWTAKVVDIADKLAAAYFKQPAPDDRVDLWRDHHIALQLVDPDYLFRAEGNSAHFQLQRKVVRGEPASALGRSVLQAEMGVATHTHERPELFFEYLAATTRPGAPTNAVALYALYHGAAVKLGLLGRAECSSAFKKCSRTGAELLWKAFLAEAFALHFLQDAFSSGHIVGVRGGATVRMGTHDFYSENAVSVETWGSIMPGADSDQYRRGQEYTAHGDAHAEAIDVEKAAFATYLSLHSLAQALAADDFRERLDALRWFDAKRYVDFDACTELLVPREAQRLGAMYGFVLEQLPRPTVDLERDPIHRKEAGIFLPFAFDMGVRFEPLHSKREWYENWNVPLHVELIGIGLAASGIVSSTTDGLFSASGVLAADLVRRPGTQFSDPRFGVGFFLRMPFRYLPFDTLLLAPSYLINQQFYIEWVARAAQGGPFECWQRRRQGVELVLFKEAGIVWFFEQNRSDAAQRYALKGTRLARFEYAQFRFPVANVPVERRPAGALRLDFDLQMGFELTSEDRGFSGLFRDETVYGIYAAFGQKARYYLAD